MKATKKAQDTRLRVINTKTHNVNFVLEPWGNIYEMAPADEYVVVFRGPSPAEPEVELTDDAVTVYGWTGSTVCVYKGDVEIINYEDLAAPAIP
jgi:hypothetical protein